ncbi:MAG: mannose-1-phosphate guanylyltransferase/mannose-6-phosphate isomerase [Actinobacteria bacterium]|nr:mannose-1-phosphate guanylyltransferase/mannose-6-phosphate isomerase [Actinomycetota bacterium]
MKAIILAGGSGTRLWPISRTYFPKQFLKLKTMNKSIFQQAVERCLRFTGLDQLYIITNASYKFLVQGQIEELGKGFVPGNILIEPVGRNTLPAIYFGVKEIQKNGDDVVAVFPSDHLIGDEKEFTGNINKGLELAGEYLITFGIKPCKPHTGYGYIRPEEAVGNGYLAGEFKEKPDHQTALSYLDKGYLWNSGMFMFRTDIFAEEVRRHCPEVFEAFAAGGVDESFENTPNISIDYGIMEKSRRVAVIPMDVKWSDLGSFDAFYDELPRDENGNVSFNGDILIDSGNNLLYTDQGKAVALIGVNDLIVVDEKDALLICRRDQSQKVKEVVGRLKAANDSRADFHLNVYRPWGSYTVLEEGLFYKIKRITVLPGKRLSYQLHYHRSEHWVVVRGTADVTIEGTKAIVRSGESTFIKTGFRHRLENPGKTPLEIIEVQLGEYLEEDDIVRFDDDFGRCV